jgi:serine/threonine protein kinase
VTISGSGDLVEPIVNEIEMMNINEEEETPVSHEGYLYKLTENKKVKKLWFKLFGRDLYFFKSETDKIHKGIHNLSGVFFKEEQPTSFNGVKFYTFSVVYPTKVRYYYVDNEKDYKIWVEAMKAATSFANLTEIYDVKEKLGNGKFGLVRLGIHKQTGRKVAVKIMSKKDMSTSDLELVRTEIEILKICQHPSIIGLHEVFENTDYFYIIMEYCSGGDLFTYIEKRGFRLPEPRAFQIIHQLCCAAYYVHSYGIAHRDLKPENILMTNDSEEAEIKVLDFGLSKIIGPNESCTEPYGTLCYVAPEVLLEHPYTKAVDMWSIGVITYLLIAGCLPFDHESDERQIAKMTIYDPVPYKGSIWGRVSTEVKDFINSKLVIWLM